MFLLKHERTEFMYQRIGSNGLTEKRTSDMKREKEMGEFLDKWFYPYIGGTFERQKDINAQLKGIDVKVFKDTSVIMIDEKAQVTLYGCPTQTFCFELSSEELNTHTIYPGWFVDEKKETTHYLLIWVHSAAKGIKSTPDDFEDVEIYLVSRQDMLDALSEKGFNIEKLCKICSEISQITAAAAKPKAKRPVRFKEGYADAFRCNDDFEVYFTSSCYNLAERPINMICRKSFLRKLPNTVIFRIHPKNNKVELKVA